MKLGRVHFFVLHFWFVLSGVPLLGQIAYDITEIGTLGGTESNALAINNSGQVVGTAKNSDGQNRAFVWQDGVLSNLETLGGSTSVAHSINEQGTVVGASEPIGGGSHAYKWDVDNGMIDIDTTGGTNSTAISINDLGEIVGNALPGESGHANPFLWLPESAYGQPAGMNFLGTLGGIDGGGGGVGINNLGVVVGYSATPSSNGEPFMWQDGVLIELGNLGGNFHVAYGVNESRKIVGYSATVPGNANSYHAFAWEDGVMTDLGTLGGYTSQAFRINDAGHIVGHAATPSGSIGAFVLHDGVMLDLNDLILPDSGWVLDSARDINEHGIIVGIGRLDGLQRGYVLTPRDCNSNSIVDVDDLFAGSSLDCTSNGIPDECDIASGSSADHDSNGVPDVCEPDCNGNSFPDGGDIGFGQSNDCNGNMVPDDCEIGFGYCVPPSTSVCPECDIFCDGTVTGVDLLIILNTGNFGREVCEASSQRADVNRDGRVTGSDFLICLNSACFGL